MADQIRAQVRMFSGCKDDQTSADVSNIASFGLPDSSGPGGAGGACTSALMSLILDESEEETWASMMLGMQKFLKCKGYTQIPQLSSGHQIDLRSKFDVMSPSGSGRTRALLIGINYVGHNPGQLSGCHNDVETMRRFITSRGFADDEDNLRVMCDDGTHESPTRDNIMAAFEWLVSGAAEGDSLFLHYSGHGGSIPDRDGDEEDGMDEVLCPVDYQTAGFIADDDLLQQVVTPLPAGCQLTAIMDCCHSGTILDLPYSVTLTESQYAALLREQEAKQAGEEVEAPIELPVMSIQPNKNDPCPCGSGKTFKKCCRKKSKGGKKDKKGKKNKKKGSDDGGSDDLVCEGWMDAPDDLPLSFTWKITTQTGRRTVIASRSTELVQPSVFMPPGHRDDNYALQLTASVADIWESSVEAATQTIVMQTVPGPEGCAMFLAALQAALDGGDNFEAVSAVYAIGASGCGNTTMTATAPSTRQTMAASIASSFVKMVWDSDSISATSTALRDLATLDDTGSLRDEIITMVEDLMSPSVPLASFSIASLTNIVEALGSAMYTITRTRALVVRVDHTTLATSMGRAEAALDRLIAIRMSEALPGEPPFLAVTPTLGLVGIRWATGRAGGTLNLPHNIVVATPTNLRQQIDAGSAALCERFVEMRVLVFTAAVDPHAHGIVGSTSNRTTGASVVIGTGSQDSNGGTLRLNMHSCGGHVPVSRVSGGQFFLLQGVPSTQPPPTTLEHHAEPTPSDRAGVIRAIPRAISPTDKYPSDLLTCRYWDETTLTWRGLGCITVSSVNVNGKFALNCICYHLTDFGGTVQYVKSDAYLAQSDSTTYYHMRFLQTRFSVFVLPIATMVVFGLALLGAEYWDRREERSFLHDPLVYIERVEKQFILEQRAMAKKVTFSVMMRQKLVEHHILAAGFYIRPYSDMSRKAIVISFWTFVVMHNCIAATFYSDAPEADTFVEMVGLSIGSIIVCFPFPIIVRFMLKYVFRYSKSTSERLKRSTPHLFRAHRPLAPSIMAAFEHQRYRIWQQRRDKVLSAMSGSNSSMTAAPFAGRRGAAAGMIKRAASLVNSDFDSVVKIDWRRHVDDAKWKHEGANLRNFGRIAANSIAVRAPSASLVVAGSTGTTATIAEMKRGKYAEARTVKILWQEKNTIFGRKRTDAKHRRRRFYVPTQKLTLEKKAEYMKRETEAGRLRKALPYDTFTEMSRDGIVDDGDQTQSLKSLLAAERLRLPYRFSLLAYIFVSMIFAVAYYITIKQVLPYEAYMVDLWIGAAWLGTILNVFVFDPLRIFVWVSTAYAANTWLSLRSRDTIEIDFDGFDADDDDVAPEAFQGV